MELKMIGKLLMMTGLLALSSQAAMASETQVTFQVPVNISNVSDADARRVSVVCTVGNQRARGRIARDLTTAKGSVGIQIVNGSVSRTVSVIVKRTNFPFKVGMSYRCELLYSPGTARISFTQRMDNLAKPGTRVVTMVAGRL